jgi:SAM-dependent methyltransferase
MKPDFELTRAERERKAYDEQGLWETSNKWHARFSHVFLSPNSKRYDDLFYRLIGDHIAGKRALEVGCADGSTTKQAFELGAQYALGIDVSQDFILRAKCFERPGQLEFRCADVANAIVGTFDLIFGRSILHHIDYRSVLKNLFDNNLTAGGLMVFMEPLGANPLITLYALLARSAHTADEKSFLRADLQWFKSNYANAKIYPFNLLSFPAGILSSLVFKSPDNLLLRVSDRVDEWLAQNVDFLSPYFRHCLVVVRK